MIKTVLRFHNMVTVFDEKLEQMPAYRGTYEIVKESILKVAPPDAIFAHGFNDEGKLLKVPREEW